jgi:hypothetical protein
VKVKLLALKGGASREGISFYIVPLDPALKGGACGALAGQRFFITLSGIRVEAVQDPFFGEPL